MTVPRPSKLGWFALAAVGVAWLEVLAGFVAHAVDYGWFMCSPWDAVWMRLLMPCLLGGLVVGAALGVAGVLRRARGAVAALVAAGALVLVVLLGLHELGALLGLPTDVYCTDASERHGRRLHSSMSGEDSPVY